MWGVIAGAKVWSSGLIKCIQVGIYAYITCLFHVLMRLKSVFMLHLISPVRRKCQLRDLWRPIFDLDSTQEYTQSTFPRYLLDLITVGRRLHLAQQLFQVGLHVGLLQ